MAGIKKPKKIKLPRKPKASASNEVLQNYLKKVADVKKENAKREAAYKSELKKREALKRKIAGI